MQRAIIATPVTLPQGDVQIEHDYTIDGWNDATADWSAQLAAAGRSSQWAVETFADASVMTQVAGDTTYLILEGPEDA